MQVTGNKTINKDLILSIRLSPSGLYFVVGNTKGKWISDKKILSEQNRLEKVLNKQKLTKDKFFKVNFCFLDKENMLVPEQFKDESKYCTEVQDGAVEMFKMPSEILDTLKKIYGDKLHLSSAMLAIKSEEKEVAFSVAMYEGICTIMITAEGKPRFAQHLPATNHADIIYYLNHLEANENSKIKIKFDHSGKLRKKLKPYYKKITLCE